jgi:hypothetical protein
MACRALTFKDISRVRFQAIRARINAQADLTLAGDSGTAVGSGFTAQFNYSEQEQTLTIQCLSKPFLVPESLVNDKIQSLVESVNG